MDFDNDEGTLTDISQRYSKNCRCVKVLIERIIRLRDMDKYTAFRGLFISCHVGFFFYLSQVHWAKVIPFILSWNKKSIAVYSGEYLLLRLRNVVLTFTGVQDQQWTLHRYVFLAHCANVQPKNIRGWSRISVFLLAVCWGYEQSQLTMTLNYIELEWRQVALFTNFGALSHNNFNATSRQVLSRKYALNLVTDLALWTRILFGHCVEKTARWVLCHCNIFSGFKYSAKPNRARIFSHRQSRCSAVVWCVIQLLLLDVAPPGRTAVFCLTS